MNLVTIISSLLTPAVVGRIASALGINPALAQMIVTAALPAILAGIAGKAGQPAGLRVLSGLLGQQNPATLDRFTDTIGSPAQGSIVSGGTASLDALFGSSTTAALSGALGKFTGAPAAASSSVLGLLAPLALGTIAKQQTAGGLDSSGIGALLTSQKDNIAKALPPGFADVLKGTGLLDGFAPTPPMATAAPTQHTAPPRNPSPAVPPRSMPIATPKASGGVSKWLLLIPALAIAVFAWQSMSKRAPDPVATAGVVDLGKRTGVLFETIKTSVSGIKDEASATASLPKLREYSAALLDMRDTAEKMPAASRAELATWVTPLVVNLQSLVTKAVQAPGTEAIVKPVLDQILERMRAMAKG